ncbi:MAG: SLBB domain-containing protein [Elusimicrobiales bacterium]|nr:SLBB domain-containing protein [Elusimicrobiales bacterium]
MFQKIFISVVLSFSFLFFNLPASAINLNGLKNDSDSKTEQSDSYLQSKSFGKISQKYENKTNPAPAVFKPLAESDFESFISKGLLEDVETKIKQFGYDLFLNPPSTFAPADNIPLSSDYIVGPGDELRISVWGKIEGSWEVQIDRNGNIALPKVGIIGIAGLSLSEFKETLKKEFSKYYTGFKMNITFGSLRSIRVYIVGNARKPGAYTVSSLSTLVNALFAAGGPNKNGSMRDIKIKRNGKTVVTFDLYDLLIKGDKSKDIRLLPEDVIFIPPVGPLTAIAGKIKNPAIYEIKDETKLTDLIDMAGGFTNTAFRGRVAMQRIFNHRFTDFFEGELSEIAEDSSKNAILQDGDLIQVLAIGREDSAINLAGAVVYPGKFGIKQGETTFKSIIKLAGGLKRQASNEAEITRVKLSSSGVLTERFNINLEDILNDASRDFELYSNDHIMIKPIADWKLYKMVDVSGEVKHPGVYTVKKGEKLSSVLKRVGGFTNQAYAKGIVFTRESVREQQQKNLEEIANRLEKQLLVEGSAKIGAAISQEDINAKKIEMDSKTKFVESIRNLKANGRVYIKFKAIKKLEGSDYDIEMEESDSIFIPSKSSVINVSGAVMAQGSYVYSARNFKNYVNMAGGYAEYADKGRTFILRADGSAIKAKKCCLFTTKVGPGDTIVVPEKFSRVAWLRGIRDITQILMNVALTAGVVIKVF